MRFITLLTTFLLGMMGHIECTEPKLLESYKIWDSSPYSAFTDLIRHHDQFLCTFRESDSHQDGENGKIRILTSPDGKNWESVALIAEEGVDLRDPKLSIKPDGTLMLLLGGTITDKNGNVVNRQSRVAFSHDGAEWTPLTPILTENEWLWRVTWHDGRAYGIAYDAHLKNEWTVNLYVSSDGINYDLVTPLDIKHFPNEATIRFAETGEMYVLLRAGKSVKSYAWFGMSEPPYTAFAWKRIKQVFGGPDFVIAPEHQFWAAGRVYIKEEDNKYQEKTGLVNLSDAANPDNLFLVPSGGDDTGYPGMVLDGKILWMSYYSSQDGTPSIYIAKILLP